MTINEIAKLSGVSRATVSRYLNDGYVSEEKREKIRAVIEQTGYQPSSQAQMLRTRRTRLVGVILPKINSDTVSRMVAGIGDVLREKDYELLLASTNNEISEELKYLNIFRTNRVDGIIFISTIFTRKHLQLLKECEVPVIILGQELSGYSCVYYNDYQAAKEITAHMLERGSRIGYIGVTTRDMAAGLNRKRGFSAALEEKKGVESFCYEGNFTDESGYQNVKRMLSEHPDVDSIFCATDTIAAGALRCLHEQGIQVPEQIQVCGIGDTPVSRLLTPPLTTVHFYYKTAGMEAARMLLEVLETGEKISRELKMGYKLIVRDSTRQ